jgi:ABC-type multidrug transport system fused ATPase/permease subunit
MTNAIFQSLSLSIERLFEILRAPKTVANRDSAIKRFALTFELAWKVPNESIFYVRGERYEALTFCLNRVLYYYNYRRQQVPLD